MPSNVHLSRLLSLPASAPCSPRPSIRPPPRGRSASFHSARRVNTIRHHDVRRRKVLIVAVGQSNNGLLVESEGPDPVLDAPDARILELSRGILRGGYEVAPAGERHVFQHPAQDDDGGICMRLAGAKALLSRSSTIEEITLFCGAKGGTSLAGSRWLGRRRSLRSGPSTVRAIMAANPVTGDLLVLAGRDRRHARHVDPLQGPAHPAGGHPRTARARGTRSGSGRHAA